MKRSKVGVSGFTLIELLVVISIIALLVGILLPALSAARQSAQKVVCLSNVRQTGVAIVSYATDNSNYHPIYIYSDRWNQTPWNYARSGAIAPNNTNGDPAFWWTSKLVDDGYLPGPLAFDCPTLDSIPLEVGNRDFSQMTVGATNGDSAWPGWNYAEYGYNAYFLGSGMGLAWKNVRSVRGSLAMGSIDSQTNYQYKVYESSPRIDDVNNAAETITLADSRNYATETQLRNAGRGDYTFGVSYLYPKTEANNSTDQYGFADPRHKSSVNVYWADGHGEGFSVQDAEKPYGQDELTDAVAYPNDNKWDLR